MPHMSRCYNLRVEECRLELFGQQTTPTVRRGGYTACVHGFRRLSSHPSYEAHCRVFGTNHRGYPCLTCLCSRLHLCITRNRLRLPYLIQHCMRWVNSMLGCDSPVVHYGISIAITTTLSQAVTLTNASWDMPCPPLWQQCHAGTTFFGVVQCALQHVSVWVDMHGCGLHPQRWWCCGCHGATNKSGCAHGV